MSLDLPQAPVPSGLLQESDTAPKDARQLIKFASFLKRYDPAMRAWAKEKGNASFPIVFDEFRVPHWVNRKERRKIERRNRRAFKNAHR